VNSNADDIDDDGECTLRETITNANNDSALYATSGECAIVVGTDTITFAGDYTITVGPTLPQITTAMTFSSVNLRLPGKLTMSIRMASIVS
jgi:hypothetical protein